LSSLSKSLTAVTAPDLSAAHLNSVSKDKVDRLAIKPFNPSFAITRFGYAKFGHVSDAIATGLEHGFDSGHSLDHVEGNCSWPNKFGQVVDVSLKQYYKGFVSAVSIY
jgi:hypothetical protein